MAKPVKQLRTLAISSVLLLLYVIHSLPVFHHSCPFQHHVSLPLPLSSSAAQARVHGCGRQYYSMPISFRQNELDEKMLLNLKRKEWTEGFRLTPFDSLEKDNKKTLEVCSCSFFARSSFLMLKCLFFFLLLSCYCQDMNKMIDLLNQRLTEENEILKEKKQIDDGVPSTSFIFFLTKLFAFMFFSFFFNSGFCWQNRPEEVPRR